jgi:hypothetical protein
MFPWEPPNLKREPGVLLCERGLGAEVLQAVLLSARDQDGARVGLEDVGLQGIDE